MRISTRTQEIQASPLRKLTPIANETKAKGIKVYHLNIGQPDIETPKEMLDMYHNFNEKVLAYGPSQGLEVYRKSLVKYYHENNIFINENDIIVTTAGSEAVIFAMLSTCDEGDEIIIPEPYYTNYNSFATMAGITIRPITTYAENGFALPKKEKFEELINEKTKAIMICNPGNPTGAVYTKEEIEMIAELVKEHDLFVISDEVYREFVYDGYKYTSIMHIPGLEERAVLIDSVSKRYSACGARIGCLVSKNKELMAGALKYAMARLCPPTIDQLAANEAISLDKSYFDKVLTEYTRRRNVVYDALSAIPNVICQKPKGAFYIIAKLPIEDAEDFVKWLLSDFSLENETVMVAPAGGFYGTKGLGRDEIRIAYILNENDLKRAMKIFTEGLKTYISQKK